MYWTLFFAAGVLLFVGAACTPSFAQTGVPVARGETASQATTATPREPMTMVGQAEAIIGARFQGLGWIESIVTITYKDQVIRLTMGRDTFTLGDLEAYTRMCRALTELIGDDGANGQVVAVQTFRADGSPVVAGTANGEPCAPFSG